MYLMTHGVQLDDSMGHKIYNLFLYNLNFDTHGLHHLTIAFRWDGLVLEQSMVGL